MPSSNINVTPQEVADLGRFCQTSTQDIDSLISKVEAQLNRTTWKSTAATNFATDWGTHKTNLGKMKAQLHDLGEAAKTMAKNYDEADAAYGKG